MRRQFVCALVMILAAGFAAAQQPAQPTPGRHAFYYDAPGITAPELLAGTQNGAAPGACEKSESIAVLSAIVDTDGIARNIRLTRRPGKKLNDIATNIVKTDRFNPGTYRGVPAAVAVLVEVDLSVCKQEIKDGAGGKGAEQQPPFATAQIVEAMPAPSPDLEFASINSGRAFSGIPVYPRSSIGAGVTAPVPIQSAPAEYTDAARKAKFQGVCLVSVIIDAQGMPVSVHLVKSLMPSLDQKAIEAVSRYRFKPAMKDGKTPVPAMITIVVDFRLY